MSAPGGTLVAEAAALTPARKRWTLLAVILGSGIVFLDTSVVNLALPRIGEELSSELFGTLEAQSYVANGYFVTLSALLILGGALSDYFGRRRMFAIGLVGFAATSLLCGIAPSMEFLIVCRILQGAAGALLVPGSLAIITATFQGEEQGRAFGLWAGASAATTIFGPFVGGLLVNTISWRLAFLINLPFLLIAYLATVGFVPESRDEQATGHFDWLGSLVVAVAVAGLAFGTIRGQQHGWSEPIAMVSLAVGGVAAIAFPLLMTRRTDPLVPPGSSIQELHGDQHLDVRDLRRAVRDAHLPWDLHDRHPSATTNRQRGSHWSRVPCSWCCSLRESGSSRHGSAHGCSRASARPSWPSACCGSPGFQPTARAGCSEQAGRQRSCHRPTTSPTCFPGSSNSGSGCPSWSRHSRPPG
jgi:predicted MFS family arabinose efflux permease